MKCDLQPNLKTDSYRVKNRTGTLKSKAMKDIKGFIHSRINLLLKTTSFITTKRFHDTLIRFRLRACGLRSHKVWFLTEASENSSCPVCGYILEDEVHVLFRCSAYVQIRQKYGLTEPVNQPNQSQVRKFALIYASIFIILACEYELKT